MFKSYLTGAWFVFGVCMATGVAGNAMAQAADVSCLPAAEKMSDSDVQSFTASPDALLTQNASGGLPLVSRVREIAGSSSNAFTKLTEVTKNASSSQRSAIAAGLAHVVSDCGKINSNEAQNYILQIQTFVAQFGDKAFASTFQEESNQIRTAAVGPGAGGVAAGGGATTIGADGHNSNSYRGSDGPTKTTSGAYSFGSTNQFSSTARVLSPV